MATPILVCGQEVSSASQKDSSNAQPRTDRATPSDHAPSVSANSAIDLAALDEAEQAQDVNHSAPGGSAAKGSAPETSPAGPSEQAAALQNEPKPAPRTPSAGTNTAVRIPRSGAAAVKPAKPQPDASRAESGEREGGPSAGPSSLEHRLPWYRSPYVVLGGVLMLIAGAATAFRKYVPTARPIAPDLLRVVGRTPLAAKQSAVLLHVGRRMVLIGISPDTIRTLAEITDAEEVAFLLGKTASLPELGTEAFEQALAREIDKYDSPVDGDAEEASAGEGALREAKGQLQGLLNKLRAMQSS